MLPVLSECNRTWEEFGSGRPRAISLCKTSGLAYKGGRMPRLALDNIRQFHGTRNEFLHNLLLVVIFEI